MGSLKTEERITKRTGLLKLALGTALILGVAALGYQSWQNRPTSEAEIAEMEALIVAGKIDEARALMVSAQVRSKDPAALRLRIGRAYLKEGRIGPATSLLSQVEGSLIKEESLAVAEYFLVSGDPFSAVRFFESAMRTGQPRTAPLLGRYAEALSLAGNGEGALVVFRESLTRDPSKPRVRLNRALTLANLGRLDEAAAEAQAVLKIEPSNLKALDLARALAAAR